MGVVRVVNIGFYKIVWVRYIYSKWLLYYDIMVFYVQNFCDGFIDRFLFSICVFVDFGVGLKLEFVLFYMVGDVVYWDNNDGINYGFECFVKIMLIEFRDLWLYFV